MEIGAAAKRTRAKITNNTSPSSGSPITPVDNSWTPPVCWYEPFATPQQFRKSIDDAEENGRFTWPSLGVNSNAEGMRKQYKQHKRVFDGPAYKDYNLSKTGKGMWWHGVVNPKRKDEFGFAHPECYDTIYWAPKEKSAKSAAVRPKTLAGYAYDSIKVPETKVAMRPKGRSTVNLPTWMWLDKAKFKPVKVTASLPGTGLSATTTAKPTSLHLDPGTPDARVHPSSGECKLNGDGSIGKPYNAGDAGKTPPCGVTYERATSSRPPYKLKATLTWKISWKGSNGESGDLPDGAFDSSQDVTVQEVQSIN